MQEYVLFGQVPSHSHQQVLQQLAGVSRMQPQPVTELHLIYKPKPLPGLAEIQKSSGGGSQGVVLPDVQKIKAMLNASLYYVQLVGTVEDASSHSENSEDANGTGGDVVMSNEDNGGAADSKQMRWALEFRDTPDPGKQPVTSRMILQIPIEDGSLFNFIEALGFEYISRYVVVGDRFYDQDTTLFLHRVMQFPQLGLQAVDSRSTTIPSISKLHLLDNSGGYTLAAKIETVDGSNSDLRDRASRQLLAMKETLKGSVNLAPGDRLALDTKVATNAAQRR